jgi:hypothetical protein
VNYENFFRGACRKHHGKWLIRNNGWIESDEPIGDSVRILTYIKTMKPVTMKYIVEMMIPGDKESGGGYIHPFDDVENAIKCASAFLEDFNEN